MLIILSAGLMTFLVSYLGVGRYRYWAEKRQILDFPNERSAHTRPIPRGGGLIIVALTLAGTWLLYTIQDPRDPWLPLLSYTIGAFLIAIVSWRDDLRALPSWIRLGAHSAAAVIAMAGIGYWSHARTPMIGSVEMGWGGVLVTFIWIVGLTNAYNFMDGIDGLAGGQAVVAGLGWCALGWSSGQELPAALGVLVASSSLGFLGHNWFPARVFMGDVGSAFLGYTFAVLPLISLVSVPSRDSTEMMVLGAFFLWPFIFDTAFTFLRRLLNGENVVVAHKSHLYQRLVSSGYRQRSVTTAYLVLAAAGVVLGIGWTPYATKERLGLIAIPLLCLALVAFVTNAERRESSWRRPSPSEFLRYRRLIIVFSQICLLTLTYYASFLLRLDFDVVEPYRRAFLLTLPVILLIKLPIFYFFHLFRGWWRYAGMSDLLDIIKAAAVSAPIICIAVYVGHGFINYPRSIFMIDPILTVFTIGGTRFAVRAYYESTRLHLASTNTLIIGAGRAGSSIARELKDNDKLEYNPVGFVDDDPTKKEVRIQGIRVLGTTEELPKLIADNDVSHLLIAIPSASGKEIQRIIDRCRECKVDFKTLPAIGDIINGSFSLGSLRSVRVEDLLAREPVRLDLGKIREKLQGQCILVTGAGGSIGSELCRQIAKFNPEKLILFDRSESDLFNIDRELEEGFPRLKKAPVVGDILDPNCLRETFLAHSPRSIFHAAAFKHVPMMERNCFQAVMNNIFGTYNVADTARQCGVGDFVMISSDKAVNPSNIMGVTKRIAELLILGLQHDATRFVSVRFGNVLGSKGSVIPLFEQQIAARKAVTITHPEVKRYFMTIPEAVQLVLQASTMGKGGEIFVLDMGEPVKIVDLAHSLIKLSGLEPGRDVPIVYTSLRPGEKLFEELRLEGEGIKPTSHKKIRVLDGGMVSLTQVGKWLDELAVIVDSKDLNALVTKLVEIVPEYTPSSEILALCEMDRQSKSVSSPWVQADLYRD